MAGCTSHDSVPSNIRPYNIGKRLDQCPEESIEYYFLFFYNKSTIFWDGGTFYIFDLYVIGFCLGQKRSIWGIMIQDTNWTSQDFKELAVEYYQPFLDLLATVVALAANHFLRTWPYWLRFLRVYLWSSILLKQK